MLSQKLINHVAYGPVQNGLPITVFGLRRSSQSLDRGELLELLPLKTFITGELIWQ